MNTLRQDNSAETVEAPRAQTRGLFERIRDIVHYTAGTALAAKLVIGGLHLHGGEEMQSHPDLDNDGVQQMQMVDLESEDFEANEAHYATALDVTASYAETVLPYEAMNRTTSFEDLYSFSAMAA